MSWLNISLLWKKKKRKYLNIFFGWIIKSWKWGNTVLKWRLRGKCLSIDGNEIKMFCFFLISRTHFQNNFVFLKFVCIFNEAFIWWRHSSYVWRHTNVIFVYWKRKTRRKTICVCERERERVRDREREREREIRHNAFVSKR